MKGITISTFFGASPLLLGRRGLLLIDDLLLDREEVRRWPVWGVERLHAVCVHLFVYVDYSLDG